MSKQVNKGCVPVLRFSEFREEGEWKEKTVGQISANVTAGGTPSTSVKKYWGGNIRWMNSGELNHKRVYEVQGRITDEGLQNSSTKFIPERSVLIGLAGQGKTRGTVAMNMVELCINQSIAAIFPNDEIFCSDFLYHNLDNRYDELRSLSAGGEGRGGLNLQIIKSLIIPLPRLKEQQKIAACLSSLDELITAQSQKLDALKTHKKGLMQQLFPSEGETAPKLRFPEFREAGEWNIKPLGDIGENLDSKRIPITENNRVKGDVPYYGASGIIDYVNEFIFDEELLCISEDGANLVARTYPIAFSISGKTWVNNHAHVLKFKNNFTQLIIENYLNSINLEDYLTGMAQPKLNRGQLDIIPIPLPNNDVEQQKIAACLSSLDELITAQAQKIEAMKIHKKGLMQQLFPTADEITA